MTAEEWRWVKAALHDCLEQSPERRAAWLAERYPDQPGLRAEVESLLASHEQAGAFLQAPALETAGMPAEKPAPGDRLGVYQIVQKIGEGGMGVVFQAVRDDDQFRKLVAIKVVKRGMDTAYILERFHNERQILAHFDHPSIAKVLDGGATPDGRPYVVIEFVAGQPIDEYCDSQGVGVRQRLELFLKVCGAVEYAHRNLVVHRDLKPSNILVTPEGEPKLLDFGIAKLLTDDRQFTVAGARLMTPEYASPEQVRGDPITTASDVYSLGVLLYELLTGRRPYSLSSRIPEEVARTICEMQPPKPSTAARGAQPEKQRRQLAGDLDNIVLMALRKEPERRYASVEQFSGDIRRYLEGLPVEARKSTLVYRGRKFVLRHRAGVLAAALVFASLVAGIIVSTRQAHVARLQRERAERRFQDVRRLARSMLFELHDAIVPLPGSTKARELLVRKAQEYLDGLAAESGGDPALQRERAMAYQRIGDVLGWTSQPNLGQTAAALANYRKSLSIYEELLAADAGNTDLKRDLATAYERVCTLDESGGRFRQALDDCHKSLRLREEVARSRPGDRTSRAELGYACQTLAGPYFALGDWPRSEEYRARALAVFVDLHRAEPAHEGHHFQLAVAYLRLANLQEIRKEYPPALDNARQSVALLEELAARKPGDIRAKVNITYALQRVGSVLSDLNDLPGALQAFRQALPIRERLVRLDPEDARSRLSLARSYEAIGSVLLRMDRTTEALQNFGKQLALSRGLVETDSHSVDHQIALAAAHRHLGQTLQREAQLAYDPSRQERRWTEARQYFQKALSIYGDLQSRGALSAEYAQVPPSLQQEIAACGRALRALSTPPS
ncbi:MAG TPA: serine/threonine-protein kinase [Bryobacteraceae bacterium]|nr:serine/threonine-protein kinase [Bryobacteraceae bacterium]